MKRLILALAGASSIALGAPALAEPVPLTGPQMDEVSAGFFEIDRSNTSYVAISIFHRPSLIAPTGNTHNLTCSNCYLQIATETFSVVARFGP